MSRHSLAQLQATRHAFALEIARDGEFDLRPTYADIPELVVAHAPQLQDCGPLRAPVEAPLPPSPHGPRHRREETAADNVLLVCHARDRAHDPLRRGWF